MNGDKKYHITLGIMIFLFIIIIAGALAVGLGVIELNFVKANDSDDVSQEIIQNVPNVESSSDDVENEKVVINSEKERITAVEKNAIEEYLNKIYRVHVTPIPNFDDINKVDDYWCFGVATVNSFDAYSIVSKEKVVDTAKEIFGSDFSKVPGRIDGTSYDEKNQTYEIMPFGMALYDCGFMISDIKKEDKQYVVELIEWNAETIDVGEMWSIRDINKKEITKVKEFEEIEQYVENNKEKFTLRKVILEEIEGKMYIKSCSNI